MNRTWTFRLLATLAFFAAVLVATGAAGGPGSPLVVLSCPGGLAGGCDLSARYSLRAKRFAAVTFGPHCLYFWRWARDEEWNFNPVGFGHGPSSKEADELYRLRTGHDGG